MTFASAPEVTLSDLSRSDGSATYSYHGYSVIGSVNGPIEAQRRNELPEEALIDVIVRPAVGVGGVRERHIESILRTLLRQVILVQNHPRTLVQITLQFTGSPRDEGAVKPAQGGTILRHLPALIQTSVLALLSAAIPLSTTLLSTLIAIGEDDQHVVDPTPAQLASSKSIHVLVFSTQEELHLAESEGVFTPVQWEEIYDHAEKVCCMARSGAGDEDGDEEMTETSEDSNERSTEAYLRRIMRNKIEKDQEWKDSVSVRKLGFPKGYAYDTKQRT